MLCGATGQKGKDLHGECTYLEVAVDHAHLVAVEHSLEDLLNAMTACKHQGAMC